MDLLKNEGRLIVKELIQRVATRTLDHIDEAGEEAERKKLLLIWPTCILPAPDDYLSAVRAEYGQSKTGMYSTYYAPHQVAELAEIDPEKIDPFLLRELLVSPMLMEDVVDYLRESLKTPGSLRDEYRRLLVPAAAYA
jgi:hypothetical protein